MLILALALAAATTVAASGCGSDDAKKEAAAARARARAREARLVAAGKRIFLKNCGSCHTIEGRTAHPTFIESPIPNLDEVNPEARYIADRVGGGGIDMGIFSFPEDQMRAVVAYVDSAAGGNVVDTSEEEPEAVEQGRQLFQQNCESCHGIAGRRLSGQPVFPGTEFNFVKPSQRMIERLMRRGIDEEMPSFARKLSDDEIHAVAVYVTATAGR